MFVTCCLWISFSDIEQTTHAFINATAISFDFRPRKPVDLHDHKHEKQHHTTYHQQPRTKHHNLHTPHHTHKSMLCISGIVKDIEGYTQEEEKAEGYAHTTHTMISNVHIHVHPTTPNTQHTTCKYSDKHRNGVSHMSLVSVGYKWDWCACVYLLCVSVYINLTFTYNITKVKHHHNPNPDPNANSNKMD